MGERMAFGKIIKFIMLTMSLLIFIFSTIYVSKASPPMPIGIAGLITVDGIPIDDGYLVIIKNENTGETVYDYTENGYFVVGLSGSNGDKITANIEYNGKIFSNYTIVNMGIATQWINISISTEIIENKKPVIVLSDIFEGYVGEEIIFDASSCYDPDGHIIKYEWTFYDYPPFTMTGRTIKKIFYKECNIIGVLTLYDNDFLTSSKTFNVIIKNKQIDENETIDENNDTFVEIPPIPPIANFTFNEFKYNQSFLCINFTSTSIDTDGYIVNFTWIINGNSYYGKNITLLIPIPRDKNFVKLNVTLIVIDNDNLYDYKNTVITFNISNIPDEKYNLIIYSKKPVSIKLMKDNEILDEDYGTYFEYYLPFGNYSVIYTYKGREFNKSINLNKNIEMLLYIPYENKTPSFSLLILIISFGVMLYVKKKN